MMRLLFISLTLLLLLYAVKVALLQLAIPMESALGGEGEEGASSTSVAEAGEESVPANSSSALKAGWAAFRQGEDGRAVSLFRNCLANSEEGQGSLDGKASCRTALGEMFLMGAGVPRNVSEARELFETAADAGDPDAQFNLGILYAALPSSQERQGGQELKRREALAVLHLYAASTAGHPGALMAMGYRHMHGYGVPQACTTAALNYIDVAKRIAGVYSEGMPQAVELVRLNLHHKDRKVISSSEMNLFVQIATSGDTTVAAAIGKRYLLGLEGFRQNYHKAKHYLRLAASRNHPGAMALLGYMHCLGLGIPQNLDTAYSYFMSAAAQNDPHGHNGLGFIYFKGTSAQARNLRLAFRHFNESAYGGSSDGMFNLASMYLTGTGTEQSFQKAVLYYTQALDRGHTPAAYSLAVMHLNGIGTVRDCNIAVNLLKKVCERGEWVSSKLVDAYEYDEKQPDKAALLFLKLAEAGHEVAQMNVAHLFDSGQSSLLLQGSAGRAASSASPSASSGSSLYNYLLSSTAAVTGNGSSSAGSQASMPSAEMRHHSRTLAQRYYEMSAEQGGASSELRLGDYAYYGWGISASFKEEPPAEDALASADAAEESEDGELILPAMYTTNEVEIQPQAVDYEMSLARYRKTAEMTVTGEWMSAFVARASFNLGFMYQFGLGVTQDLHMAKLHYHRCREVDPSGVHTPVTMVLLALGGHMFFLRLPAWRELLERLLADVRVHLLLVHCLAIAVIGITRCRLSNSRPPRRRAQPADRAPATDGGRAQPAPETSLPLH